LRLRQSVELRASVPSELSAAINPVRAVTTLSACGANCEKLDITAQSIHCLRRLANRLFCSGRSTRTRKARRVVQPYRERRRVRMTSAMATLGDCLVQRTSRSFGFLWARRRTGRVIAVRASSAAATTAAVRRTRASRKIRSGGSREPPPQGRSQQGVDPSLGASSRSRRAQPARSAAEAYVVSMKSSSVASGRDSLRTTS